MAAADFFPLPRLRATVAALAAAVVLPAAAQMPASPSSAATGQVVYTRAVVRGLPEPGAAVPLAHLKIAPRGKRPFSTLAFRVDDPALLQGIAVGDEVGFTAERRSGANTLTRLRKVAPCVRFQHCPVITD